jgi:type I restriction enzyme M protein
VVLDTGAVSRGSGSNSSNKERDIRKAIVGNDLIECVILLPENLFYNTSAPGIIMLLNQAKPSERQGQILLVNASTHFRKEKPKNVLTDEGIAAVAKTLHKWKACEKLSALVSLDNVRAADYNLSPSQFVDINEKTVHRPLSDILRDLSAVRVERERTDLQLTEILRKLDLEQ